MTPYRSIQLDAARGIAAAVVLTVHLAQTFWMPIAGPTHWLVPLLGSAARHAVLIFFLLSGYLIVQSIHQNLAVSRTFNLKRYASSRMGRLYPPLLVAIASTLVIAGLVNGCALNGSMRQPFPVLGLGLGVAPAYLIKLDDPFFAALMIRGMEWVNPPFWSLYVEARLYVLAGLVACGLTWRGVGRLSLVAALYVAWASLKQDRAFWVYALVWCVGGMSAILQSRRPWASLRPGLSLVALAVVMYLALTNRQHLSIYETDVTINHWMQVVWGVAYAALLFDLKWSDRLMVWPAWLATWSYTLYLLHWPYLILTLSLSQRWIDVSPVRAMLMTLVAAAASLTVAYFVARLVERPAFFSALIDRCAQALWQRYLTVFWRNLVVAVKTK